MKTNNIDIQLSPRETVVRTIEDWISKGVLPAGSAMPAEDELARKLNVSRGTVRTGLELLEKCGMLYKQNRRRYVAQTRNTIPEISPLLQTVLLLGVTSDNPIEYKDTGFLKAIQAGALDALSSGDLHALSMHADKLDHKNLQALIDMKPRGAVIFQDFLKTTAGTKAAQIIKNSGIPVVIDYESPELTGFDRVIFDHEASNYRLTEHFINQGCRNILCFYPNHGFYWYEAKYAGYLKALRDYGLQPMPPVNNCENYQYYNRSKESFDEYTRLCAGFLVEHFNGKRQPQAILASSDWDVPVLGAACRLFGKEPGRDVQIGGYDNKNNSTPWREFDTTVSSATIDKNNTEIGRKMIDLLKKRINNELSDKPLKIMVQGELIIL